VKNMVAGVGSIDLAVLVVAADDGWMPQTEEHLQILVYLGVARAVVALTKIDLAQNEAVSVAQVREKLSGTPFADAPIVPTSTANHRGFDELKAVLCQVLASAPPPRDVGKPRLPVDRVFTLRGIGTVVTGTLTGGTLQRGQAVVINPGGKTARIRSLQNHNRDVPSSAPGTRTAVNLPDIAKGSERSSDAGVHRGEVITIAELGPAADTVDVLLEKSGRLAGSKSSAARPLKDGGLVRIHHGSSNHTARAFLLDQKQIDPGQRAIAQLRFDEPVCVFIGDHLIVRDWQEQATLAGGVVLDLDASRKAFRSEAHRKFLERRAQAIGDPVVYVETQLQRDGVVRRAELLANSLFSASEITIALEQLAANGSAVLVGDWAANAASWQELRRSAAEAIDAEHKTHPGHAGLPLSQLRSVVEPRLRYPAVFDALVTDLCRAGFVQSGMVLKRGTHRPALPPHLQNVGARLRAALAAKPFDTPSRNQLAPDAATQQALRFLRESGEVLELADEVVLLADSFSRMKQIVGQTLAQKGRATASELRQALGTPRRIVIPVLERLDQDGFTRRQGDFRTLRSTGAVK
jgi:selenocysteine-specific elongation factor